jgi:hypothetical protein
MVLKRPGLLTKDEQDDEDDPNDTLEKSKLGMVAIRKAFPSAYEDEPPMGPLGHEDVDTTAQSVDRKPSSSLELLIVWQNKTVETLTIKSPVPLGIFP